MPKLNEQFVDACLKMSDAEKKAIEAAQKEQELVEKAAAERSRFEKAKSMRMEAKKRLEKTRALRDPNLAQNDDALGTSI